MPPKIIHYLRLLRLRALFDAMHLHCNGAVLDIGGRNFFRSVVADKHIHFTSWTCLELERSAVDYTDQRYKLVVGDGEHPPFEDGSFDTVLNLQVLEHTMEPIVMVKEIARVLRPCGKAIFLIPQTSALHEVPTQYYNFTKYWVEKAFEKSGLSILEFTPLGGRWSTHASHMFYFFLEAFRLNGYSAPEYKRNLWFYLLFPFMALYALLGILMGLIFSAGDLTEDPNNLLVVAIKKDKDHISQSCQSESNRTRQG